MIYRRGDLALVPFPFTDLSSAKRRPVLLLADPDGYGDFLAVAVTSRPHHSNAIAIGNQDISSGALPASSWVRTDADDPRREVWAELTAAWESVGRFDGPRRIGDRRHWEQLVRDRPMVLGRQARKALAGIAKQGRALVQDRGFIAPIHRSPRASSGAAADRS
jgi:hypothetical protein